MLGRLRWVVFLVVGLFFIDPVCGYASEPPVPSAFDRVLSSGVLRCGYIVFPPQIVKDPNSGKLSGAGFDIIERIGHDLGLKVDWVEEVGSASWLEGLQTNRYDLVCSPAWATTPRARLGLFSEPVFFTAVEAYVRADDTRFDNKLEMANDPSIKIAVIDGSTSASIGETDFPDASKVSLPDLTDFSQILLEVQSGKADITFTEAAQFHLFDLKHPGVLRPVKLSRPVRVVPNSFCARTGEHQLVSMLNLALQNMQNNGFIDAVINRHEPAPGMWRRVALPYR